MKLLQIYNDYRSSHGGEVSVVRMIAATVERHGGTAQLLTRSSKGLDGSLIQRFRGFFSGIYNYGAYREVRKTLDRSRPEVVHVHNVYPWFSPSVFGACRAAGVPVVMTHHNYLLTCPVVSHLRQGRVCEKCLGGREYWCVLHNCRQNLAESVAYSLRSATARKLRMFHEGVTLHIVLSDFARQRLINAGFPTERIVVLPNMVETSSNAGRSPNGYVAYSGRMASEKGVDVLLHAARNLPDVDFRLAGDGPILQSLTAAAPENVHFTGRLSAAEMATFYQQARFLVVPSKWFEGCPLVVSEAMSRGLPVIASRIGGLPEFVDNGVTGLLFEPGDAEELSRKIQLLWGNDGLCARMSDAAREKAALEYGEEVYYRRLMAIYEQAIAMTSPRRSSLDSVQCDLSSDAGAGELAVALNSAPRG